MSALPENSSRKTRRSHEDRTAETRSRLLAATIECLNKVGYSGTTIGLVSEVAGVTRGGLLHHFPSKVDLLIATAEHCIATTQSETTQNSVISAPRDLLRAMQGPAGIALMEIMLASRSDQELLTRFKVVANNILELQRGNATALAERESLTQTEQLQAFVWLSMGALRGMMLMELSGMNPGLSEAALAILLQAGDSLMTDLRAQQSGPLGNHPAPEVL